MVNDAVYELVRITLALTNVLLHGLGMYLLFRVRSKMKDSEKIQFVYVANLSLTELFVNLSILVINVIQLASPQLDPVKYKPVMHKGFLYPTIVTQSISSIPYYSTMLVICLDQLFLIRLNIRYPIYWNGTKARRMMIWTWIIGVAVAIALCLVDYYTHYNVLSNFLEPLNMTLDFIFLTVSTTTYFYIFHKFHMTKKSLPKPNQNYNHGYHNENHIYVPPYNHSHQKDSCFHLFFNSKFLLAFLLVLTFFVFVAFPHGLIKFSPHVHYGNVLIGIQLACVCDCLIYILLQRPVRKLLMAKLRRCGRETPSSSGMSVTAYRVGDVGRGRSITVMTTVSECSHDGNGFQLGSGHVF